MGDGRSAEPSPSPITHHPSPPSVLDGLASLIDQSLLQQVEQPGRGSDAGSVRYSLLETVREFGLEQLEACREGESARARHAAYFLGLAEEATVMLRGGAQLAWLTRLEVEHDNVRAALCWSLTNAGNGDLAIQLAGALSWFWHLHGHYVEGRRWLEEALALPAAGASAATRARALTGTGFLALLQGDAAAARERLAESVAVARTAGDAASVAYGLQFLGAASLLYE